MIHKQCHEAYMPVGEHRQSGTAGTRHEDGHKAMCSVQLACLTMRLPSSNTTAAPCHAQLLPQALAYAQAVQRASPCSHCQEQMGESRTNACDLLAGKYLLVVHNCAHVVVAWHVLVVKVAHHTLHLYSAHRSAQLALFDLPQAGPSGIVISSCDSSSNSPCRNPPFLKAKGEGTNTISQPFRNFVPLRQNAEGHCNM